MDTETRSCGCGGAENVTGGQESFGNVAYSGAAVFGRVYSTIGMIIGLIIALILVVVGYNRLHDKHTKKVTATVTDVSTCVMSSMNNNVSYSCTVTAAYAVGGKSYSAKNVSVTRETPVTKGSTLVLWYDPAAPQNAVYELSPKGTGWALIGVGLLIGGISTGVALLTYKYKGFAAGYGAIEGVSMLGRNI